MAWHCWWEERHFSKENCNCWTLCLLQSLHLHRFLKSFCSNICLKTLFSMLMIMMMKMMTWNGDNDNDGEADGKREWNHLVRKSIPNKAYLDDLIQIKIHLNIMFWLIAGKGWRLSHQTKCRLLTIRCEFKLPTDASLHHQLSHCQGPVMFIRS